MPLYKAGADVDAYCTKCKMVLAHVIIAIKKNLPARVECKTCRATHAYKATPPGTPRRGPSQAGPRPTELDRLLSGRDVSRAERYDPSSSFAEEQVIDHKQFGLGVVTRSLSDNKIEVVFRDGLRVLVHAR